MSLFVTTSDERVTNRDQLIGFFKGSEKSKENWLIGCEHEKFAYRLSTLAPVPYDGTNGLSAFMSAMEDFGWAPVLDQCNIIGLKRGRAAITFEPGGQVELAGSPLKTLHEVSSETDQHLTEACEIAARFDIGFLGMGFHPTAKREEISWVPKSRYKIMREYMPKVGSLGLDMMLRTCTVQVNLDYASEADMVKKFRVALALQPIATALFASSPFVEGKPSGYKSYRMNVWTDTDRARSGSPQFVYEDGFGYERYTEYALDVPMYFVYRDGKYIDCSGQSFRDFMQGKLPALPGELPTMGDWTNHLTTIFTDVRLKNILEMRGADSGTAEMLLALPSLWVGLLYDQSSLDGAYALINNWTVEDRLTLYGDAPKLGLAARVRSQTVAEISTIILTLAKQGLRRRANRLHGGADEARYLDVLFGILESRQTLSDQILMQYEHYEDFSMEKVFELCRLKPPPVLRDE